MTNNNNSSPSNQSNSQEMQYPENQQPERYPIFDQFNKVHKMVAEPKRNHTATTQLPFDKNEEIEEECKLNADEHSKEFFN